MSISIHFSQADGTSETIVVDNIAQTLMQVARDNSIVGIVADCGGACACATCHVHIDPAWIDIVGQPSDVEANMLDLSTDPVETSRLSCQIELSPEFDGLRVSVPGN